MLKWLHSHCSTIVETKWSINFSTATVVLQNREQDSVAWYYTMHDMHMVSKIQINNEYSAHVQNLVYFQLGSSREGGMKIRLLRVYVDYYYFKHGYH